MKRPSVRLGCMALCVALSASAQHLGAPTFMRIDFSGKVVVGPLRTSPIVAIEKSDAQLLLQGTELGFAWAIALDQASGRIVATAADRDGAFVMHGACTPL